MLTMADPEVRYPIERLIAAAQLDNHAQLALRLGLHHDTVRHAAALGLTDRQADRWAVRLGLHPAWVWPTWFADTPDGLEASG